MGEDSLELDYLAKARNGSFRESMEARPDLAMWSPRRGYTSATTRKVLTTGWINGARLDESKKRHSEIVCDSVGGIFVCC